MNLQKIIHLTRDWTQITCIAVNHSNNYTRMFFVLVWGCNWILFVHGRFCPFCIIHLIGRKSLHFEKKKPDYVPNGKDFNCCYLLTCAQSNNVAGNGSSRYPVSLANLLRSFPEKNCAFHYTQRMKIVAALLQYFLSEWKIVGRSSFM